MGMGLSMEHLARNARALRETWMVWFEGGIEKFDTRKKLEENFEHFLKEVEWGLKAVKEEWRSAFKKEIKRPRFHEELHRKVVRPKAEEIERKWAKMLTARPRTTLF